MERELEELAVRGAEVLVAGVGSLRREEVLVQFSLWFESHQRFEESDDLISLRENEIPLERWADAIREVLSSAGAVRAASELAWLIRQFTSPMEPQPPTRVSVSSSTVIGDLVQAGSVDSVTINEPPVAGDHVDIRQGTFHGQVVGVQHNTYGAHPGGGAIPEPESWPTVAEADPLVLGVRPTWRLGADPELPPYVARDVDDTLRGWNEGDCLLVFTGGPLSGKSRTALDTVVRTLAGHTRVYAPAPGVDLRGLPGLLRGRHGNHVLWLDELEGHLGERGLDMGLLAQLTALHVPVVATMRDEAYDEYRFGGGQASRLLGRARTERLSSTWSEAELERLAQASDPRLVEAVAWRGDSGVTQYLAIGPELRALWHSAARSSSRHPRGHLLVRAAIDLALCGVTGDIPQELLEAACGCYGRGDVPGLPEREPFDEALTWAEKRLHEVTGMLVRGEDRRVGENVETWRPYGSLVAEAVRNGRRSQVPLAVWRRALEGTRYDAHVHTGVRTTAQAVFAPKAAAGDPEGMRMMGLLGEDAEDEAAALEWFRRAADAGQTELAGRVGELLFRGGKAEEALPYLRTAAGRNPGGTVARLLGQAHLTLAEHWLREAADSGDSEAAHQLGDVLLGQGDTDAAGRSYMNAEAHGYSPVARSSGLLALLEGSHETAEVLLRRAADAGDERAAGLLRFVHGVPETLDAAEESFEELTDTFTYPLDATHHGAVLEKKGLLAEARKRYEEGYERGDAYGAYRLAALLEKQGGPEEATLWYHKAADMGHPAAQKALAENAQKPATVKE